VSLGLVGGGGSVLAVPALVYLLDQDVKAATTASLAIVGLTAAVGGLDHARAGRVRWRTAAFFGLAGAAGTIVGTALNRQADPDAILLLFALVLLAAAWAMVRQRGEPPGAEAAARGRALWSRVAPAGVSVGVLTGFFGVGGGFVVVPALVLGLGVPLAAAVGTSLVVIALTSTAGLAAHLATGGLDWAIAGAMTVGAVAGAGAGSRLEGRVPARRLSQLFAAGLAAVAVLLIVGTLPSLA
jgi:uncharacterized membrane protein YfcA